MTLLNMVCVDSGRFLMWWMVRRVTMDAVSMTVVSVISCLSLRQLRV